MRGWIRRLEREAAESAVLIRQRDGSYADLEPSEATGPVEDLSE
jgi:hypothetical protein